jgi:hypothetical protein
MTVESQHIYIEEFPVIIAGYDFGISISGAGIN